MAPRGGGGPAARASGVIIFQAVELAEESNAALIIKRP